MKKHLGFVLSLAMAAGLTACGGNAATSTATSKSASTASAATESATSAVSQTESTSVSSESTATDSTASDVSELKEASWKPDGTVSLILPASPGGTVDLTARLWAQFVNKDLGWEVVVVNSAGASGSVAANQVLASAADGLTCLYGHNLVNVANVAGVTDYNYEAFKLGPNFAEEPAQQLYTNAAVYPDLNSLIEDAKAHPGELKACTEVGAYTYYELLAFEQAAGIDLQFVDVGSTSEKMVALLGEQVMLSPSSYGVAKDYVESGQFACIGFPGENESSVLPGIKTLKEQGVDCVFAPQDFSFYFPKDTSDEVIEAFEYATQVILQDEECLKALADLGEEPLYMDHNEAAENEAKLYNQFKSLADSVQK